jgi:hypothetical protein
MLEMNKRRLFKQLLEDKEKGNVGKKLWTEIKDFSTTNPYKTFMYVTNRT